MRRTVTEVTTKTTEIAVDRLELLSAISKSEGLVIPADASVELPRYLEDHDGGPRRQRCHRHPMD